MPGDSASIGDVVVRMRADTSDVSPQIATLAKTVTDLGVQAANAGKAIESGLGDQIAALEAQGKTLTESLAACGAFIGDLQPPLAEAGAAATDAAAGIAGVGDAAGGAVPPLDEVKDKIHSAGDAAKEAEGGVGGLLKELLAFVGIGLSLEALKEFTLEAVNLFAETEKTGFVLGRLTGDAKQASKSIEELKETAVRLAIPFEDLLGMQVRLTNFGVSIQGIRSAIQAAADAAAGTHSSFGATEGALERIAETGMASGRVLRRLGIESKDLATAMGISADEVSKAFKDTGLTIEERVAYLHEAIEGKNGLTGLAEDAANLTAGSLDRFKIKWQLTMEEVGKAIGPAVSDYLPKLTNALKDLVIAGDFVVVGLMEVINVVVGLTTVIVESAKTYGKVWVEAMKGPFGNVVGAAKEGFDNIKAASKATWDSIVKDAVAGYNIFDEMTTKKPDQKAEGSSEKPPPYKGKPGSDYAAQKIRIDEEATHQKALFEQTKIGYEEQEKLGYASAAETLARLTDLNNAELEITRGAIARKLALQKGAKEEEKDLTLGSQLKAAEDKTNTDNLKLQATYTEKIKAEQEKRSKNLEEFLARGVKTQLKGAEYQLHDQEAGLKDSAKAQEESLRGNMDHQTRGLESQRSIASTMLSEHRITQQEKLAIDRSIDDQEDAIEKEAIQREIALLASQENVTAKRIALQNQLQAMEDKIGGKAALRDIEEQTAAYRVLGIVSGEALTNQVLDAEMALEELRQMNAPQAAILQGLQKRLEAQIALNAAQNKGSSAEIIALTNIQLRQKALADSTNLVGNLYKGLMGDINGAFDKLGQGLVKGIMDIHNFGKAMKDALKSIAEMILTTVIGAIMQWIAAEVILAITHGVTTDTMNQKSIAGSAGRAGAAQFADVMESVPFPANLVTAPIMAALAEAAALGFGVTGKAAKGALWPEDSVGFFQAEEMTLPPDISRGMKDLIKQGGSVAGNARTGSMFDHCTFSGVTKQLVEEVFSKGVRQMRLEGVRI